jgi:hypothetical protein
LAVQDKCHHPGLNASGLEFQKDETHGLVVVLGVEFEGQEVIAVDVDGKVGVAPDGTATFPVGRHL